MALRPWSANIAQPHGKFKPFISHTEAGPEVEVKLAIKRIERVRGNVGGVKGEEPVEDSLPGAL
jgi:hypothetical protein